jgi:hypothetical protein
MPRALRLAAQLSSGRPGLRQDAIGAELGLSGVGGEELLTESGAASPRARLDRAGLKDAACRHRWSNRVSMANANQRCLCARSSPVTGRRLRSERGESFGFLGFDFRYLRGLRGAMRPHYTPKLKKRTALMRELKEVFRRGDFSSRASETR